MMPAYNARKRKQDEARREQQADERVRELEEALDAALTAIRGRKSQVGEYTVYTPQIDVDRVEEWQDVLDGGGEQS